MKILSFPSRPPRAPRVAERIARVEELLAECLGRQSTLKEEARRLQVSLGRLRELTREMVRKQDRLRLSLDRLRGFRRSIGPPGPAV